MDFEENSKRAKFRFYKPCDGPEGILLLKKEELLIWKLKSSPLCQRFK